MNNAVLTKDNLLIDQNKILDDLKDFKFIAEDDVVLWKFGPL